MRVFKVTEDVFKVEPLFVTDCTHEEMRKYLHKRFRRLAIEESTADHSGQMFTFGICPWRVVWVRRGNEIGTLAHEITHLVTRICQDKGIPIIAHHPNGDIGDETAAYMIDFYLTKAIEARRGKKRIAA